MLKFHLIADEVSNLDQLYDFVTGFFESFTSWLTNIWELISNAFKNAVYFVNIVGGTQRLSKFIVGYLPEVLAACFVVVVFISVIKLILGRQP